MVLSVTCRPQNTEVIKKINWAVLWLACPALCKLNSAGMETLAPKCSHEKGFWRDAQKDFSALRVFPSLNCSWSLLWIIKFHCLILGPLWKTSHRELSVYWCNLASCVTSQKKVMCRFQVLVSSSQLVSPGQDKTAH